jgi:hypothetical protein
MVTIDHFEKIVFQVINGELKSAAGSVPVYRAPVKSYSNNLISNYIVGSNNSGSSSSLPLYHAKRRLIHLDLKGAPPKVRVARFS